MFNPSFDSVIEILHNIAQGKTKEYTEQTVEHVFYGLVRTGFCGEIRIDEYDNEEYGYGKYVTLMNFDTIDINKYAKELNALKDRVVINVRDLSYCTMPPKWFKILSIKGEKHTEPKILKDIPCSDVKWVIYDSPYSGPMICLSNERGGPYAEYKDCKIRHWDSVKGIAHIIIEG